MDLMTKVLGLQKQHIEMEANLKGSVDIVVDIVEDEDDKSFLAGKIQIMTMHKSKGDEFNLVFLPEMSEKNLPLTLEGISLKSSDFIESVKNLNPSYTKKSEYELKQEILSENLRLLYVAITRAKNRLIFTVSSKTKTRYGKEQQNDPSSVFEYLSTNSIAHNVGEG